MNKDEIIEKLHQIIAIAKVARYSTDTTLPNKIKSGEYGLVFLNIEQLAEEISNMVE